MKVIQTEYKGYLFRSRLEARWAAISTSLQGTSIPAVRTPSKSERKSLTNLQT